MSDIEKAARDAVDAADNTELVRTIAAILAVQKATEDQTPAPAPARQEFDAKKWLTIGGLVVAGGGVVCFLALAAAVLAVAVAIGGTCATACLLVLRSMWRDFAKGR
ncbi:hypothetical protein [Streptomyces sp. NPDC056242]|uniref:hypothetical protein n=1 Tax=Streptomyces sp. NPDC056242 TaxID=3345760 RepID=UPI0035D6FD63